MLAFILCMVIGGIVAFVFLFGWLWCNWEWIERIPTTITLIIICISWIAFIGGLGCSLNVVAVQRGKNEEFLEAVLEKQVLEEALKNEDLRKSEALKARVDDFNNNLKKQKTWSSNIWFGATYNDKIASIDYIVYPD